MSGDLELDTDQPPGATNDCTKTNPTYHLLPKKETGCSTFLRKHPRFDGGDILIAILDTGVDPAAAGLQVTSSGKRKLIDIIDCTGSGHVDTSTIRTIDNDGYLLGLSGRKLRVPDFWTNPTGKYHLGVKNLYEFYPKPLLERIQKERRTKNWDPLHRLAIADVSRQTCAFEKEHGSDLTELELKWKKEDLKALDSVLSELDEKYDDCGRLMDCVVFHDGKNWRACIDVTYCGRLKDCKLLGSFLETEEYARFSETDFMTYTVNFHENGNVLEIATTSGSHGTHVASIAAANFPHEPEKNGVSPGARLISLCIGDNRLNAMETGAALLRAINKCIELKVDIINFSYSEATHFNDFGPILKSIEEAVYKHNIIFICAASNSGPALSTVHCPGGYLDAVISVGAYVSAEMMTEIYSMLEAASPSCSMFSWTSRGPCPDGGLGVSVCAPGAAFTSVPNWTLKNSQLQHGTSMSSPNVTGCVACVLSGFKYENVLYSPLSVKRALENTARRLDENHDYFSMGYGIIQIEDAFNFVMTNYRHLDNDVRYSVTTKASGSRGIYLRELYQVEGKSCEISINVNPIFKEDISNDLKVNFEKRFILTCRSAWIICPSRFTLSNEDRNFSIKLVLENLKANDVHFTEVIAQDSDHPDIGPLWRFPITIIKPMIVADNFRHTISFNEMFFKPGTTHRCFVQVPPADWAALKFQCNDKEKSNQFAFHALQLFPHVSQVDTESYKNVCIPKNGETVQYFNVIENRTLELCIAKWWSSAGDAFCRLELSFHGLAPLSRSITMLSSDNVHKINFTSKLRTEDACPAVNLNTLCKPVKPVNTKLAALGPMDLFQDGRQIYQLLLTYEFSLWKTCEITATFPPLSNYLYENEYVSQLWMVFTKNKQFLFAGEAYPDRYYRKLDEGDYMLLIQIRHENKEMLENLKDQNAILRYRLPNALSLDCYPTWSNAVKHGKKFGTITVPFGVTVPLYFTPLAQDKLPTLCTLGCYLIGFLTLSKHENAKQVAKYEFKYLINNNNDAAGPRREKATIKADCDSSSVDESNEKTINVKYADALRDLKLVWLNRLDSNDVENVFNELKTKYETHLPLYLAKMHALIDKGAAKNRAAIIDTANYVIEKIDEDAILRSLGTKADYRQGAENDKKEISSKKSALIESLIAKGSAICDDILSRMDDAPATLCKGVRVLPFTERATSKILTSVLESPLHDKSMLVTVDSVADNGIDENVCLSKQAESLYVEVNSRRTDVRDFSIKDADAVFVNLMKYCDATDSQVAMFCLKHSVIHCHYGRALNFLKIAGELRQTKDLDMIAIELYEKLGWMHASDHLRNTLSVRYLSSYRLF